MAGFGDARALKSEEVKVAESRRHELSDGAVSAVEAVAKEWFDGVRRSAVVVPGGGT